MLTRAAVSALPPPTRVPASSSLCPQHPAEVLGAAVRGPRNDLGGGPNQQGGYIPDDARWERAKIFFFQTSRRLVEMSFDMAGKVRSGF